MERKNYLLVAANPMVPLLLTRSSNNQDNAYINGRLQMKPIDIKLTILSKQGGGRALL